MIKFSFISGTLMTEEDMVLSGQHRRHGGDEPEQEGGQGGGEQDDVQIRHVGGRAEKTEIES